MLTTPNSSYAPSIPMKQCSMLLNPQVDTQASNIARKQEIWFARPSLKQRINNMKTQHTPTPWYINGFGEIGPNWRPSVLSLKPSYTYLKAGKKGKDTERIANAEFIVRAVNEYQSLKELQ